MIGATGTGKTWYGPIDSWERLRKKPGLDLLVVGRNRNVHIELLINYIEQWLRALGQVADKDYFINRSLPRITLSNGSQFFFGSDEAPNTMEGHHYSAGAWIDEAALMSYKTWEVVQRRVGMRNLPILITSIPYQSGWVQQEIYEVWRAGGPDAAQIEYVHLDYRDNPAYDEKEIERQRRRMPKHEFDRIYLGVWSKPAGMIFYPPDDIDLLVDSFPVADDQLEEIAPGLLIPIDWPMFSGHDYGFTNPTTGVWGVLSPDDVLYIVAEYEESFKTMAEHVAIWKEFSLHKTMASFGDPAEPGEWLTATEHGMVIQSKIGDRAIENDVKYGIDLVKDRLQTGRLKILRGVDTWLKRREEYTWAPDPKSGGMTLLEKPLPSAASHLMDATRYLCVGLAMFGNPNAPLVDMSGRTIRQGISRM